MKEASVVIAREKAAEKRLFLEAMKAVLGSIAFEKIVDSVLIKIFCAASYGLRENLQCPKKTGTNAETCRRCWQAGLKKHGFIQEEPQEGEH